MWKEMTEGEKELPLVPLTAFIFVIESQHEVVHLGLVGDVIEVVVKRRPEQHKQSALPHALVRKHKS